MRAALAGAMLLGLALAATPARAGGAAATATKTPKVETWIGTWSGKATSKGCTTDATAKVDVDVALTAEGGLRSNGDVLEDGLGDVDWTVGKGGLSASRTGLTGSFTVKGNSAKLALKTEGGCSIKATLKRASSGMADCDRLLALATVESQCSAMPSDSRGKALGDTKSAWSAWAKLKGKKRSTQATQCKTQADTIATAVASCGDFGNNDYTSMMPGLPDCADYMVAIDHYASCDKIPQAARDAAKQGADAMRSGWAGAGGMPDDAKKAANDACKQATDALRQGASAMGCAL